MIESTDLARAYAKARWNGEPKRETRTLRVSLDVATAVTDYAKRKGLRVVDFATDCLAKGFENATSVEESHQA